MFILVHTGFSGATGEDGCQPGGQVESVRDSGIHALTGRWAVHMSRGSGKEHPAGAEPLCDAMLYPEPRRPGRFGGQPGVDMATAEQGLNVSSVGFCRYLQGSVDCGDDPIIAGRQAADDGDASLYMLIVTSS